MAKKPTYVAAPKVPEEVRPRYEAVLRILAGDLTVSAAARQLGLARNHFQMLMHRSLAALLAELQQKPPGRPATSARQKELEAENSRLRAELARLDSRGRMLDRLLGIAGDLAKGRKPAALATRAKAKRTSKTRSAETKSEPEDPDGHRPQEARNMRARGLSAVLIAVVLGCSPASVRRWVHGPARPLAAPRPKAEPAREAVCAAEQAVRELHGGIGAEALKHLVRRAGSSFP